ncbi:OmpA family protein [Spongiivirga sp. MCCC 1A20706]|uniref:OmpA family protein n=1 Tax=Spongiivirga sp. MCCC 1A20706 TaxID=3160963 RepID=UPI0039775AC1
MRNFLLAFAIFLGWSIFGIWYYTCKTKNLCIERPVQLEEAETIRSNQNLSVLADNGDIIFQFDDQLQINNKNGSVFIPQRLMRFKDSIFHYLNKNQDKELIIKGFYKSREADSNGSYGLQRASFIKRLLVDHGINADRILVKANQEGYEYSDEGTYNGGIEMLVNTITKERKVEIDKSITNKTLYADFGSKEFVPDNTLKAFTAELKSYLDRNPDKTVNIIGHTDNVGSAESNTFFGAQRALNVKNYLISQGIDANKLKNSSQGEAVPIASNDTEEGRAKNRRIEIIVN